LNSMTRKSRKMEDSGRPKHVYILDTSNLGSTAHLKRRDQMVHLLTAPPAPGGFGFGADETSRRTNIAVLGICKTLYAQKVDPKLVGHDFFSSWSGSNSTSSLASVIPLLSCGQLLTPCLQVVETSRGKTSSVGLARTRMASGRHPTAFTTTPSKKLVERLGSGTGSPALPWVWVLTSV
jgi:hypothetical protein